MKKSTFLAVASLLSLFTAATVMAQNSNLLFKSSFDNISINKISKYKHFLSGTDATTGYTFPNDLPGNAQGNYFNYVINDHDNYSKYVATDIRSVTGMDNTTTDALYIEYIKDDETHGSTSRVQYVLFGDESSNDPVQRMNEGYFKYKIKIHLDKTDSKDYMLPVEWKDTNDDGFRMGFYIYASNTRKPYYVVKGQFMEGGNLGENVWQENNYTTAVIEDEWFELEVYWLANPDPTLGKLKVAINGEVLFDVTNQTKDLNQPNKMYYFMPFKVYGTVSNSYITDFEYRDAIPTESILSDNVLAVNNQTLDIIKTHPNPTSDVLHFTTEYLNLDYQIIDLSGSILDKGTIVNGKVNVSNLSNGLYIIKIFNTTTKTNHNIKFIKK